jgi:hypothetical protein
MISDLHSTTARMGRRVVSVQVPALVSLALVEADTGDRRLVLVDLLVAAR